MLTLERALSVKDANESLQLTVTAAPSRELGLLPVSPSHPFQEWKAMELSALASAPAWGVGWGWEWQHQIPLGMAASNSLAHLSSRASSMAHPFLVSHLKKWCGSFLEGSSLPDSHDGLETVCNCGGFYFFHNKNIDTQDNIRPQVLPRKSLCSSLWLCY